jgi:hypothetical protein
MLFFGYILFKGLAIARSKLIYKSVLLYNQIMLIPRQTLEIFLADAIDRDRTTARRLTLCAILLHERYLTRQQLIVRVEGKLGAGCFGESAWVDIFYRDMQVVKKALRAAGYQLVYSRRRQQPGYYLSDQPSISSDLSTILDGSVAEVDPSQIAIFKGLSFRQRFLQGCSISNLACQVAANRLRQRNPQLSLAEAQRMALQTKAIP